MNDRDANSLFAVQSSGESFQIWLLSLWIFGAIDWTIFTFLPAAGR